MFAEPTVSGVTYLDMLLLFLEPQLIQDQAIDTVVCQQDGASPHLANIVRNHLNEVFTNKWIGRGSPRIWVPRSPDLTPLHFFAWGYTKAQVYRMKIRMGLPELRNLIQAAVDTITPQLL